MTRLYELVGAYKELEQLADEGAADETAIRDTLDGLTGDIEVKAQNVAAFIRNLETDAEAIELAAEKMKSRAAALRRQAGRIHEYLFRNMTAVGIRKIECPYFVLTVKKNPPHVIVDNEELVPPEYWVHPPPPPPRLDKKELAKDLKAGLEVPGAHIESLERLEIVV